MSETVVTGYHAIEEALRSGRAENGILHISRKNERILRIIRTADARHVKIKRESDEVLNRLSADDHRGVVLELSAQKHSGSTTLEGFLGGIDQRDALVLILDGITDPQNLGAILRSADQFGVDLVVLPTRRSAGMTGTVMKVSAGAAAYLKVAEVHNLARAMVQLKNHGFWIYGADLGGTPPAKCEFAGRSALVMGAEGKGLGRLVAEHCDRLITIPMTGHVDSLNVSVAAGIILYEIRRSVGS